MSLIRTVHSHSGFTLLEVMVALVIFSIGLLGLAGMQSAGIRNNQISYSRTLATQLAYDMADRIRNNDSTLDYSTTPPGGSDCINSACTPAQMAGFDITEWNAVLADPNGPLKRAQGFIQLAANGTYTITIGWNDGGTAANPSLANCQADPIPDDIACVSIELIR